MVFWEDTINTFRWNKANGVFEGEIWKTGPHPADAFVRHGKDHTEVGIPPGELWSVRWIGATTTGSNIILWMLGT
jgi:hypothetical protein